MSSHPEGIIPPATAANFSCQSRGKSRTTRCLGSPQLSIALQNHLLLIRNHNNLTMKKVDLDKEMTQ